jgi:hypothetical protein
MLLDPLVSRLGDLDTHKDAEVRQALEPLVAIADRVNMAILGIIHHNKSGSSDPLQVDRSDLDAWVARLDALGTQHGPVHENDDPTYAAVLVHDPDGIPIELFWSAA